MAYTQRTINMPTSKYSIKCPYSMVPECIVVHNTANDASAVNEIKYMQSNDNQVSFHFAVDDKEVVQGVPLVRNAWHAGDGGNGKGNRTGIAIEICYSKSGGTKFVQAEKNAAAFIAHLLKTYGWGIDKVTKHQDYGYGKYCPHRTLDMGWERFLKMVQAEMGEKVQMDDYTVGGLRIVKLKNPRLVYLDAAKNKMKGTNCCNAGFFGNYRRNKTSYTLPVGNLVCDMTTYKPNADVEQDIKAYIKSGKLRYDCKNNAADSSLLGKVVSTIVIPSSGKPYVADLTEVPATAKYAVSGVPCVRNSDDVDWYNYVAKQGWGTDTVRNTYHNWLGVRDGAVWLIAGKSSAKSGNMIYGMWFWDTIKDEGFEDIIKLDGGGSYYCKIGGKVLAGSTGSRMINNYLTWD